MRIGLRVPHRTSGGGAAFYGLLGDALRAGGGSEGDTRFLYGPAEISHQSDVAVSVPLSNVRRRIEGGRALTAAVRARPVDILIQPGSEMVRAGSMPHVFWPLTVAPLEPHAQKVMATSARGGLRLRAQRAQIASSCRRADAFVFSSYYARTLYRDAFPSVANKPSCVISPAPSLPAQVGPLAQAEKSDVAARGYLLFVSHLYPYKMVAELLRGYAIALRGGLDVDLVIAGNPVDSTYAQALHNCVTELNLTERVAFLGNVAGPELGNLYRGALAFVFPSSSENAGSYALIDAFLFGLPVFSSFMSSNVEAGQYAPRYFDPRDPESLASQLLASNQFGDWAAMAANSLRRGVEFNDWAEIASQTRRFCRELLV